jgi:phosphate-selective porin
VERLTFDSTAANDSLPSTSPRADTILGNSDKAVTFGVNWYLNRWVKVQFNWIRETLTDPEQGPLPDKPSFSSRVLRLQFSL